MSVVEAVQGSPWTSVRFFSTFEEANTLREALKSGDTSGTLEIKVKRCGEGGNNYVVKTRQGAQLLAIEASLTEELQTVKTKSTKRTRKAKV